MGKHDDQQLLMRARTGEANMQLPNLWLYDMVDEFVYQYQSFAQFKGRRSARRRR